MENPERRRCLLSGAIPSGVLGLLVEGIPAFFFFGLGANLFAFVGLDRTRSCATGQVRSRLKEAADPTHDARRYHPSRWLHPIGDGPRLNEGEQSEPDGILRRGNPRD